MGTAGARKFAEQKDASAAASDAASLSAPVLIVNADDWGRSIEITDRILECMLAGVVSSTSAMVFMEDSQRAAELTLRHNLDIGLHLNLTTAFSAANVPHDLREQQERIAGFLLSHRYAPAVFHPLLAGSFRYVVKAQLEEFERLYGVCPSRIDGHHHMHLCANVQWQKLLPARTIVRRNFTFAPGEKGLLNRLYRARQDRGVLQRHQTTDLFFNFEPIQPERLKKIADMARGASVELETHPALPQEYSFLMNREIQRIAPGLQTARGYHLRRPKAVHEERSVQRRRAGENAGRLPHICVGICTYKRPEPLKRLLKDLAVLKTDGEFTYSILVVDNDANRSGESAVQEMVGLLPVAIKYRVQPERGIARARNMVVANMDGDYLAFIDDDEFPEQGWLLHLLRTCERYGVDGVLGPVKRYFDHEPPSWLSRSSLYDRPVNPTGLEVKWRDARTGNVLLRRSTLECEGEPFRPEFRAGEDQDFFHRRIEQGFCFLWCADAVVHEVLPQARWKRRYYFRKALLQGGNAALQPDCDLASIVKSLVAIPLYTLATPFAAIAGQHRLMTLLVKICDHAGKLLALVHMNPIREEYVSD